MINILVQLLHSLQIMSVMFFLFILTMIVYFNDTIGTVVVDMLHFKDEMTMLVTLTIVLVAALYTIELLIMMIKKQ